MIKHIATQAVYVEDQAAAEDFWVEKIGFSVHSKMPMGNGLTWLEVGPKTGQTKLALYPRELKPDWQERQPSIVFQCDDVEATYEELKASGVAVGPPPTAMQWGTFCTFQDPDGNDFLLKS